MSIELHIVTVCAVLLAIDPARRYARNVKNWMDRRKAHRAWKKQQ